MPTLTPQITLTADLQDITGVPAGSTANPATLQIVLCNYGLTLPQIPGTSTIAKKLITCEDVGSGISVELWGNDVITPTGSTYYAITVFDGENNVVQSGNYQFTGTLVIDLSEATQIYPVPLPPTPTPPETGITQLVGDVVAGPGSGTVSATVEAIQGHDVATTTPALSDVLVCRTAGEWSVGQLTADDILPGFTINSFNGGQTVEIGATVTNPAFTASYSATPASANITNTQGIDSPLNLTTPFTSGTVTGSFTQTTQTSTTFTLSATSTASVTRTATQAINWEPLTYGGVGTAGATGATASGSNAVLAGATGTLANVGLGDTYVGQTFGPYSPSAQKIYLLIQGGSHTFKDAISGFAMPFNTPTYLGSFTNQHGATVPLYLYESTNTLSATYQPEVFS